jgi:hypothetical protein
MTCRPAALIRRPLMGSDRPAGLLRPLAALLGGAALAAAGCASPTGARGTANGAAAPPSTVGVAGDLERAYVIGPAAAREIGYRIDWQYPDAGRNPRFVEVQHDSVFVLDERNALTRLDRARGDRIWRVATADAITEIHGIAYVPEMQQVYLLSGGSVLVFDAANGLQIGRQRLEKIANTAPVVVDEFLVYGGRNGQVVWHSFAVAALWKAYQVAATIEVQPVLVDGHIVTVGSDGSVAVLRAGSGVMAWEKKLLSPVVTQPAVISRAADGAAAVYVAGLDQHLWAYDLYSGRNLWRYLTESALTDPPVAIGNRVYQHVESEGLVCLDAFPPDEFGGRAIWTTPGVRGRVIAARGDRLLVWDGRGKRLSIVEQARGARTAQLELAQATHLLSPAIDGRELYAASADGRVTRLVPR